jgi:heme/copper-type cytochrome/quinol oxidase subunit 2
MDPIRNEGVIPLLCLTLVVGIGLGGLVTLALSDRTEQPAYEARSKASIIMWLLVVVAFLQVMGVMIYATTTTY